MTDAQRAALEVLIERELTAEELEAIEPHISDPDNRNDVAIAAILSEGRTKLVPHLVTDRGVVAELGTIDGEAVLAGLEAFVAADLAEQHPLKPHQPAIRRMVAWLQRDPGLDIGSAAAQQLLPVLVATGYLPAPAATALAALARRADPWPVLAISRVLNVAEGRMQM